jgi:COPII coat assembly protein SEC16
VFPISGSVESRAPAEVSASNPSEAVSSLFNDGVHAANLFAASTEFPVSGQEESLESTAVQLAVSEAHISDIIEAEPAAGAGTDDLIDDLDFIDDSEFMAAFASASNTASPQVPPVEPTFQQAAPAEPPRSRYAPQPAVPYSAPNAYTPQHVVSVPSSQPSNTSTTALRSVSAKYEPSAAPRPSTGGTSATQSPQVSITQPGWNQTAVPASQTNRPAPKSTSSFVTAKGGYSSPYDLPPQIAPKLKRHVPPPIPTYQKFPDVRAPLTADFRTPLSVGPPPRAASAQPQFPVHQSLPPVPSQAQHPNFYPPPQVASPPIHSPLYPSQTNYAAPHSTSPPMQNAEPVRRSDPYAPVKPASPPVQRTIKTAQSQEQQGIPPQTSTSLRSSQSMNRLGQHIYAPEKSVSPPGQHTAFSRNLHPPQRVVSPPYRAATGTGQLQGSGMSQQPAHAPPTIASGPYAPVQASGPQRSVSISQPPQPAAYLGDLPADLPTSRYAPNRVASPSYHNLHQNTPQASGLRTAGHHQPPVDPHATLGHRTQSQHVLVPDQLKGPMDAYYTQTMHSTTYLEENPHADLPPHFEMESDSWNQNYDPEGLVTLAEDHFIDRTIQKTPEPIENHPQDVSNDVSPPRPWDRAVSQFQSPPKTQSFSHYDPKMGSHAAPPAPAVTIERQRSISPLAVRAMTHSPKKELPMDRSQSYPSRIPPSHLKFPAPSSTQSAPRTLEEDFQTKRGGYPIVSFGFGGKLITMIPRTPHRVNIHGVAPLAVPGHIAFSNLGEIIEPPAQALSFPGPLFASGKPVKGRSKDIGTWLDSNIAQLDQMRESPNLEEEHILRLEDKKVLIKLLRMLVDNNGVLDGRSNPIRCLLISALRLKRV